MINYKFSADMDAAFALSLKQRVNLYFSDRQLSRNANVEMVLKSVMALSMYLVPYLAMIAFQINNLPLLFSLWILMGFAMAFIGTSVMHDSLHGSYSKKRRINFLMGVSAWIIGVDPTIWKLQHNVLHHSYTNIEGADEDIDPRYVLRFSPNQPLRWFHRYQHIYALFFYTTSTLIWVLLKDYVKAFQFHKRGLLKKNASFPLFILEIFLRKMSYFFLFLVVPIYVLPVSTGAVIMMFVSMHLTAGFMLSMIFQPAHVIHTTEFYDPPNEEIKESWLVHQLKTTTNFGTNNRWLTWFTGGLNHQVEHHLFPNICHIHYSKLAKIVRATAEEHNLPYLEEKTIGDAVSNHFRTLKKLGRGHI